jgi:hypothetical protein
LTLLYPPEVLWAGRAIALEKTDRGCLLALIAARGMTQALHGATTPGAPSSEPPSSVQGFR